MNNYNDYDTPRLQNPVGPQDHILGSDDAPVTLVEYGDYECPFCGQAHVIIKQILEEMGSNLRFVFRHFPLTQLHPHAMSAALAAESAGEQGKFWEMHDTLYENQENLEMEDLVAYAQELSIDSDQFVSDMKEGRLLNRIREDFRSGVRSGVNGTPAFFINGYRYEGSWGFEALMSALEEAREEVQMKSRKRKAA